MEPRGVARSSRLFVRGHLPGNGGETAGGRPAVARLAAFVTPARLLAVGAFGVLLVSTVALVARVHATSAYVGDDLITFWRAKALPFRAYLMTPIDVHFIPLHRLVSYLVYAAAGLDYGVGLATLVAVHLATVALLYRLIQSLAGRTEAVVFVSVYGLHPCLGPLFVWWTSGLHRLGYALCTVAALHAYLKFRNGSRWWLAACAVCSACSVGFYSKGVLVPLYVLGVEAGLRFFRRSWAPGSRVVAATAVGVVIAVGYVVAWRAATLPRLHGVTLDVAFLARFVEAGVRLFIPTLFGVWLDSRLAVYVVTYGALAVLVIASVWASRRALVVWAALAVALVANLLLIGASTAKAGLFGLGSLMSDRYYLEMAFVFVIFAGMGTRPAVEALASARIGRTRLARTAAAAAVIAALVALSLKSRASFEVIRGLRYPGSARARDYMLNLRGGVAALHAAGVTRISLRDTPTSRDLIGMGSLVATNASLLELMNESVQVSKNGVYVVQKDGNISRIGDRR